MRTSTIITPAGNMNQNFCAVIGYPGERARRYLACSGSGLRACPEREVHFFWCSLSHIINPLLTKLVRSRWLDIGLVPFFCVFMVIDSVPVHKRAIIIIKKLNNKRTWPISRHLDLSFGKQPIFLFHEADVLLNNIIFLNWLNVIFINWLNVIFISTIFNSMRFPSQW